MAPKIVEGEARFWDLLVKVIASGIAIGTVVVGCRTLQRQGDQLKIQQKQLAVQQSKFETTSKEQAKATTALIGSPKVMKADPSIAIISINLAKA